MPIRVMEVADGLAVAFVCSGDINGRDFLTANAELLTWEPEKLRKLAGAIVDHSGSSSFNVESSEIGAIVASDVRMAQSLRPGFLVAVVAVEDIQFGLSRMWQGSASRLDWEIHVERTRADAIAWLRERARLKFKIDIPAFDYSA